MLRTKLLNKLCAWILVLAVIFGAAVYFSWFNLIWWFDMPMHFLGGIVVFYIAAILWLPALKWVPVWRFVYESLITAVLLGVLWEALEFFLFMRFGTPSFILLDSFSDVFFDLSGALLAAYLTVPHLFSPTDSYETSVGVVS
jgi:hypothetical protein